jgi:hypothetical protein
VPLLGKFLAHEIVAGQMTLVQHIGRPLLGVTTVVLLQNPLLEHLLHFTWVIFALLN